MTGEDLDALVIGAGAAGLSAGRRLAESGARFLVLEATDRVGGRARTDYAWGGLPLELGAQMIHGREAVTHAWVARAGLRTRVLPVMPRCRLAIDRRVAAFPYLALPFHPVVGTRATWAGLYGIPRELAAVRTPDRSLADFLDERPVPPGARLFVTMLHAHVHAADPDAVGVVGPAEEDRLAAEPYGFRNFQLVPGYSALMDSVARELGGRIRRNSPVTEIRISDTGVRVTVAGPPGTGESLVAPAAIVTVPLGVLRAGAIVFDPPLPEAKRAAMVRIGFGDCFALHLRVRDGTFRRALGDFGLLWGDSPSSFLRPRVGLGEPTEVVTAFTVGREARRRASLREEDLVAATAQEWADILPPQVTLGTVTGALVHRWPVDPWTRGGYSYLPPGVGIADRRALAAPVGDRLYFAGEATDVTGQAASVAGAIATGRRAAEELLAARNASSRRT